MTQKVNLKLTFKSINSFRFITLTGWLLKVITNFLERMIRKKNFKKQEQFVLKKDKKMVFGMMDSFGRAIKKVDSFMDKDGVVQTQLNWFEARTRVKKRYILAGCIILTGWLMFGLLAPFVVSLVSFVYPAIQSVKGRFYHP